MTYFIVPIYNVEKYLKKCLDSIIIQTGCDFTIVCVNDGSTDTSPEIIKEYCRNHSNIIVINKNNGGLSSARNAALNAISFDEDDFVVFVDSDDYLDKDFLKVSIKLQHKYDADLVCTSYKSFNEGTAPIVEDYTIVEQLFDKATALRDLLADKIKCHSPCKLYKAHLWDNVRFDEGISFLEDQYLTPQIFNKCDKIVVSNFIGYYYLHRPSSLCGSKKTNKKIIDAIKAYIFLYNYSFDVSSPTSSNYKLILLDQFFDTFLMLYPRFDVQHASENEIKEMNLIKDFNKETKAKKFYQVTSLKRFFKKMLYTLFGYKYVRIYRFFEKN